MLTPRYTVLPARTSGQSMLPPKLSGTMVERTSPPAGATPRQPRNGASGTSQPWRPSDDLARATPPATSYRQTISGRVGPRTAVRSVPLSAPKPGKDAETAYRRAGVSLAMRTARVSPGSAPSTKNGPVCGLSCPAGTTLEGRVSGPVTVPSKQSSVQLTIRVPGLIRATGGAPPKVYLSSPCLGT